MTKVHWITNSSGWTLKRISSLLRTPKSPSIASTDQIVEVIAISHNGEGKPWLTRVYSKSSGRFRLNWSSTPISPLQAVVILCDGQGKPCITRKYTKSSGSFVFNRIICHVPYVSTLCFQVRSAYASEDFEWDNVQKLSKKVWLRLDVLV